MLFQPGLFVGGFKGDEPQNRKNLMSLVFRQALPAAVPDEVIRPFAGDEAANSPSRAIKIALSDDSAWSRNSSGHLRRYF